MSSHPTANKPTCKPISKLISELSSFIASEIFNKFERFVNVSINSYNTESSNKSSGTNVLNGYLENGLNEQREEDNEIHYKNRISRYESDLYRELVLISRGITI